jgi:HSP20 family protein
MSLIKKTNGNFPSVRSLFTDILDVDRFFENDPFFKATDRTPSVNIKEKDKAFEVELVVPGMNKKDFKIQLDNNILRISAEKSDEKKEENEKFTRREFSYNSFVRAFELPSSVNADAIDAQYQEGILRLSLPKKQEAQQKAKKEISIA